MVKFMVVDSGARGHLLALTYLLNSDKDQVIVAPGNDGLVKNRINRELYDNNNDIIRDSTVSLKDPQSILAAAKRHRPDLIDVAQDDAIAAGTVDLLQREGFRVFGPSREAAQIEWDKSWARDFMKKHDIPHPEFRVFRRGEEPEAIKYAKSLLETTCERVFFKASGLYGGKGVVSASTIPEIAASISDIYRMGQASQLFLVEEGMRGEEFSFYAIVAGDKYLTFRSAQDNKKLNNRDEGPNTGGMGANSPALVTSGFESRIADTIIKPTIEGLVAEGRPYTGILYLGGMVCEDGTIRVVEFNSRWGDPECHVVIPGSTKNYADLINATIDRNLSNDLLVNDNSANVCIVATSTGYPDDPIKGKRIWIDYKNISESVVLLSAGIKVEDDKMYTDSGRVLSVISMERDVKKAREAALAAMGGIVFEDNTLHYRTDIAQRDIERLLS